MSEKRRLVVGVTGATGAVYAQRLLDNQKDFAKNLLDASAPVRNKAKRPVAPVTATKAAKSKAA